MNRIIKWIQNNIFGITLYLGVSALVFDYLFWGNYEASTTLRILAGFFSYDTLELQFLKSNIFNMRVYIDDSSFYEKSYLDFVHHFLLVLGSIIYRMTKGRRILVFCLSISFISAAIIIVKYLYWFIFSRELLTFWLALIWLLKFVLVFFVCFTLLRKLLNYSVYRKNDKEMILGFPGFKFLRPRWYSRFFNLLIDTLLIILVFSNVIFYYNNSIAEYADEYIGPRFSGSVVFIVFSSLYYLFFEGILKTTPGKIITNTRIVSFDNKSVSFGRIVGRTLSRRIPFNAFSFFGKIGWHDSISNTTLVKLEKEEKKNIFMYRVIGAIILLGLLYIIFSFIF